MPLNPTLWSRRLQAIPSRRFVAIAVAVIIAIGLLDHLTGPVVSLAILYLVPVAAAAWFVGSRSAYALAALAAITWAIADRVGPLAEPKVRLAYLNDLSMLALFVVVIAAMGKLRREVAKQRELMQAVQRHLLPASLPSSPDLEMAARWIPAWTLAGDYYDVVDAGADRVAVCLADVSGKGINAALIMSNVQATVRAVAGDRRHAPDRVLAALNHLLCERLKNGFFVTAFYGVIDRRSGTFSYANAGHPPALLRRGDGTIEPLTSTGPVAGFFPNAAYRCLDVPLRASDSIIIYSDGITEYENRAGEQFGEARLRALLARSPVHSAEETCAAIAGALDQFGQGRPFNDDVTMLVAKIA